MMAGCLDLPPVSCLSLVLSNVCPGCRQIGGGKLPLQVEDWEQPALLQGGRYVTMRSGTVCQLT